MTEDSWDRLLADVMAVDMCDAEMLSELHRLREENELFRCALVVIRGVLNVGLEA